MNTKALVLPVDVPAYVRELIGNVENKSDSLMKRVRVDFKNGYHLSIIQGEYSYGGDQGLFEIAPINQAGEMDGSLLDEEHQGDDVLGYCNAETLNHYMHKLAHLPKE